MLEINFVRENKEKLLKGLSKRNMDAKKDIELILNLDEKRRSTQSHSDEIAAEANALAKSIGSFMKEGKKEEAEQAKSKSGALKDSLKTELDKLQSIEEELKNALLKLPNVPHESVKVGKGAEDNETVSEHGSIPTLPKDAVPHWELTTKYQLIDFELGNKLSGSGFPVYTGKGARLQRALINFFLDTASNAGYREVQPPIMVNEESAYATGQLPDKDGQMYAVPEDKLFLIPTAEVPVTNIYRDVIVNEKDLPLKNVAYTPCFRREAGSYGKDVRGLNRLHQFDKVEIVQIAKQEDSYAVLEEMCAYVEGLLKALELPYRKLRLCGGDMGFTSALTYDMEVFSAAQDRWLEVSSVSNFETFQSNRLKLRYRDGDNKKTLAHTLNGSALALPRIVAALLENNQSEKGIVIPKVLRPYTGFDIID